MNRRLEKARSFRAMNTDVAIILGIEEGQEKKAEEALKKAQEQFTIAELNFSRFNPESELSRLNNAPFRDFKASPELFALVEAALEAARLTGGIFDPTILPCLLAAGYDRSFEKLAVQYLADQKSDKGENGHWQEIRLDRAISGIYIPEGVKIDLGGIGKGWTVDRVSESLDEFASYAVDAGGDIRVKGTQANGAPWTIGLADPALEGRDVAVIELKEGAVCTSTTRRRIWKSAGADRHHLIDPRSGEPCRSGIVSATVLAESASRAEIIAKTAIILGREAGLKFIESQKEATGLLITAAGQLLRSAGFMEIIYA